MKKAVHKDRQNTAHAVQQERMVQKQVSPNFLDPAHEWRRIFAETWGTFLLVLVAAGGGVVAAKSGGAVTLGMVVAAPGLMVMVIIYFMGTASGARNIGANGAIAVGGYIVLAGLWAAPISGASMNPIRSFAPDLVRGDLSMTWIYVVGPVLGALIGVAFEWVLKGKPTAAGALAAQGSFDSDDAIKPDA